MKTGLCMLLGVIVLLFQGCASSWSLRTEQSDIALQWPYQPNRAKITYVMAVKGFSLSNASRSLIRTVVYGQDGDERDTFGLPVAVATGRDDRMAVADMGLKCVHLYVPAEHRYLRLTNADKVKIASPVSVIFDDDLNLYVSDSAAGKVFVFSAAGEYLKSIDHAGEDSLKRPTGLAYSRSRKLLYVADTLANRIYAFNTKGEIGFSFGGGGEEQGRFNYPTHIFLSPAGVLYVTDSMNFRVEIFDDAGGLLTSFGHHGDGFGDIARPKGIAADKDGVVYVTDSLFDIVQLFSRDGIYLLTLGKRGSDLAEFWMPSGIFIDYKNTLYVCDTYNRRIQVFQITENYSDEKF